MELRPNDIEQNLHSSTFLRLPIGVIIIQKQADDRFIVLDINPAAEKVGGWPEMGREHIIGKNMLDLFDGLVDSGLVDMYNRVLETGEEIHLGRFAYEDSRVPWSVFSVSLIPLATDRFLVAYINITEQIQAEAKIRKSAGDLKRSHEELDSFIYIASHDLQEPLRKIQTFCEFLHARSAGHLSEQELFYLMRIMATSERMQGLLDELKEYVFVTSRSQPFGPVGLGEAAREAAAFLEHLIEQRDAIVEIEELDTIEADATQMKLLFQNLIGNALKFQPEGRRPKVRVFGERPDPERYELVVQDNGIGIDPEHMDRIFRPFERLHGVSEYPGSGMGLAICNKIVERHDGEITVESTPGEGTRFRIALPYRHAVAAGP